MKADAAGCAGQLLEAGFQQRVFAGGGVDSGDLVDQVVQFLPDTGDIQRAIHPVLILTNLLVHTLCF